MCTATLQVDPRFVGPPGMGNGGYVSGLLARYIDGPAAISLWRPTPLKYDLCLEPCNDGVNLQNGSLIAEARPTSVDLEIPTPPSFDVAKQNQHRYAGFQEHPFPGCFVCGPDRGEGDGLRIFPAQIPEQTILASAWVPDESLAACSGANHKNGTYNGPDDGSDDRTVAPEFLWAALDCPGGIAAIQEKMRPILLATLEGHIERPIQVGEKCVVTGWLIKKERRKHTAGTAIFNQYGELAAWAKALWIEPRESKQ